MSIMARYFFFFIINILLFIPRANAQSSETQIPFIESVKNGFSLDTARNEDFSSFYLPDSSMLDNKVFFTGENHRYRGINSLLELKMFKYLHEYAHVNVFIMEFGHSRGWLINHYITTGDSLTGEFLRRHSYLEYWNLYKSIRDYYLKQPDNKKFKVVGIDVERELSSVCRMVFNLMDRPHPAGDSIDFQIQVFRTINGFLLDARPSDADDDDGTTPIRSSSSLFNLRNTYLDFRDHFNVNLSAYEEFLGKDFTVMKNLINGADKGLQWEYFRNKNLPHQYILRESYMYEQMMSMARQDPQTGYYGQFGRCHTPDTIQSKWCESFVYRTLASRLNLSENPLFNKKVCSIGIYYFDHSMSKSYKNDAKQHEDIFPVDLQKKIKEILNPGLTLVSLENGDSISQVLKSRFDLVVMYKPYSETNIDIPTKPKKESKKKKSRYSTYMDDYSFLGMYGAQMNIQNSSPLKIIYQLAGASKVNFPMQSLGFEMGTVNEDNIYVVFHGSGYISPELLVGDTLGIKMGGYQAKMDIGGNVTGSSRIVLCPYGSLGYGIQHVSISKTDKSAQPSEPYFGTREIVKVSNPSFWLGAGADARIFIGDFFIRVGLGYHLDVSKKTWFTDSGRPATSGAMKFSGSTINAGIGFRFEN